MNKKNDLMKGVYQSFLNAGLSPQQAAVFSAEVGRENDFNPKYIFGSHGDKANHKTNLGFISWQGTRRDNLIRNLSQKGLMNKDGTIIPSQASLDEQARFLVNEIRTNPAYAQTRQTVLENPNVDYKTASRVIGRNFIKWDYDGNTLGKDVVKHHTKRDNYYQQFSGIPQKNLSAIQPETTSKPEFQFSNPTEVAAVQTAQPALAQPAFRQPENQLSEIPTATAQPLTAELQQAKQAQQAEYLDNLKIKPLYFDDFNSKEHQIKMAAAFGEYPNMSSALPDFLNTLTRSIYESV